MNYCSIQDAWGSSDYISDQFKKYDNIDLNNNIQSNWNNETTENFTNTNQREEIQSKQTNTNQYNTNKLRNINQNKIHNINYNNHNNRNRNYNHRKFNCYDFHEHISNCKHCQLKLQNNISTRIIKKIQFLIYSNKDSFLLVLIILFSIIFLNLFFSLFRK